VENHLKGVLVFSEELLFSKVADLCTEGGKESLEEGQELFLDEETPGMRGASVLFIAKRAHLLKRATHDLVDFRYVRHEVDTEAKI
jgi:hypothetical protein